MELPNEKELNVIQVYVPTSAAIEEEDKLFYELVDRTIERERRYYTLVMGDWNAKVGLYTPNSTSVKEYKTGETNKNGEKLVNLA